MYCFAEESLKIRGKDHFFKKFQFFMGLETQLRFTAWLKVLCCFDDTLGSMLLADSLRQVFTKNI